MDNLLFIITIPVFLTGIFAGYLFLAIYLDKQHLKNENNLIIENDFVKKQAELNQTRNRIFALSCTILLVLFIIPFTFISSTNEKNVTLLSIPQTRLSKLQFEWQEGNISNYRIQISPSLHSTENIDFRLSQSPSIHSELDRYVWKVSAVDTAGIVSNFKLAEQNCQKTNRRLPDYNEATLGIIWNFTKENTLTSNGFWIEGGLVGTYIDNGNKIEIKNISGTNNEQHSVFCLQDIAR